MATVDWTVFVDFDGTITKQDVCHAMVSTFAREGWEEINRLWENKELTTLECARETFKLFTINDPADFHQFFDQMELDPHFVDLVKLCGENHVSIYIISDGYDYYIKYLLEREGLTVPFYANELEVIPELKVEAPYHNPDCGQCGVCKKQLMAKLLQPNTKSIYLGDGYSDFCPAQEADYLFAKGKLYQHSLEQGRQVHRFDNFGQVLPVIAKLINPRPTGE